MNSSPSGDDATSPRISRFTPLISTPIPLAGANILLAIVFSKMALHVPYAFDYSLAFGTLIRYRFIVD